MNWEAIGAMAQIIGALVVVVTVLYLAIQTKQHTLALQASVRQGMLSEDCHLLYRQMDFPFISLSAIARREMSDWSDDQLSQLASWYIAFLRTRENYWLQYQAGNIDEATWHSYRLPIQHMLSTQLTRSLWSGFSGLFNASFVEELNRHMAAAPPIKITPIREVLGLVEPANGDH